MRLTTAKAKASGKRGSQAAHLHCIEGEYVTLKQIGDRVGVSEDTVRKVLAKLRKQEGAVTWDKIRNR
jgi:biotin operon repressor